MSANKLRAVASQSAIKNDILQKQALTTTLSGTKDALGDNR